MRLNNQIAKLKKSMPSFLKNKYAVALIGFLIFITVISKYGVWTQFQLYRNIHRIERDKEFYEREIKELKKQRADFEKDGERYAREKYYVKKPNEEVFVIEKY